MNTRLNKLSDGYQMVIVGGGVYGAALCWEAAHRGINVLLVERDDYACGASSNSLKIIHGGLRALQSLDCRAMLRGIRERKAFMQMAPNYVRPLQCAIPTGPGLIRSPVAMMAALALYNSATRFLAQDTSVGQAHLMSARLFADAFPVFAGSVSGKPAAVWYDAQVSNTERVVWQFVRAALRAGASATNHVQAVGLRTSDKEKRIIVRDMLTGSAREIAADVIVDCSGSWGFASSISEKAKNNTISHARAVNLVVKKKLSDGALGISSDPRDGRRSRMYFLTPWRNRTIIGTWYMSGSIRKSAGLTADEARNCIADINNAAGKDLLAIQDICHVHVGYLPIAGDASRGGDIDRMLLRRYQLRDISSVIGYENFYVMNGTKYTMARHDAEQAVDKIAKDMRWCIKPSRSSVTCLYRQAKEESLEGLLNGEVRSALMENYGAEVEGILSIIREDKNAAERMPGCALHIKAEIIFAVRQEQAMTLSDVLMRRLDIGSTGPPKYATAKYCASVMQELLCWSEQELQSQMEMLYASYPDFVIEEWLHNNHRNGVK